MKDPEIRWRAWRNQLGGIALAACLAGCATVPRQAAVDESKQFELKPEAARRADAVAHYGAGMIDHAQNRFDEALVEFEKAVELDPGNEDLAADVSREYLRRKQYDKAIALLERSIPQNPNSVELLYLLGYACKAENQPDKAQNAFQRIVQLEPAEIGAYRELVVIYLAQNKRKEALKLLNDAYKQKSDDDKYWALLGDMFAATVHDEPITETAATPEDAKGTSAPVTGKRKAKSPASSPFSGKTNPFAGFARALECYEKAVKLAPEEENHLKRLADLYVANKLIEKAVPLYLKLLEQRPNRVDIREQLANAYIKQDDNKKAIAQIEEIVKKEPLKFKYYMLLGILYLDASRGEKDDKAKEGEITEKQRLLEKALDKFQQAVVLNSNEIDPQLNIVYIYLLLKKPAQALETLDRAKEKFPTNPRLFYFYGLAHSDLKQYEQSMRAFADSLALASDTPGLLDSTFYFYYGAACERAGNLEAAAEQFRKSIDLNPDNAEAYNYMGYMWADKGVKLNEALDYIKKALEYEPDNGAYLDSLGWVYFKLGKYEEALQELLRAASKLKEPDPTVFDHIAEVYIRLGKKNDAIQHWQKAIEVDPNNKEIAEKLKQSQSSK